MEIIEVIFFRIFLDEVLVDFLEVLMKYAESFGLDLSQEV